MPFKDLPKISFVREPSGAIRAYIDEHEAAPGEKVRVAAVPLLTVGQRKAWDALRALDELTTHAEIADLICAVAMAGYEYGRSERGPDPRKERRKRK